MMGVEVIVFFLVICSVWSQCLPNYQYTDPNNGLCVACLPNCLSCLDGTTCYECMPQYYLENSTCVKCSFGCSICSSSSVCSTCNNGLYLTSSGSCSPCGTGVATCTIATIQTCQDNYFFLSSICAGCLTHCQSCSDFVTCSNCESGYYLSADTTVCLPCPTNCLICTSATSCSFCSQGYTQGSTGCIPYNCSGIDPFCLSCTSSTCLSCKAGKYLSNGMCLQGASVLCLQASGSDYTYCDTGNYGCQKYSQIQNDSYNNQMPVCLPLSATKTEQYLYFTGINPSCGGSCSTPNTVQFSYSTTQAYYLVKFYLNIRFYANIGTRSLTVLLTNSSGTAIITQIIPVDVSVQLSKFSTTDPNCLNCQYGQTLISGSFVHAGGQYPTNFSIRDSVGRISVVEWMLEHLICQVSKCSNCTSAVDCYACFPPYFLQLSTCVINCDAGFYRYGQACYLSCPATTYTLSSAYSCLACLSPCKTCSSASACLTCLTGYFLDGSNCLLSCSSTQYFANITSNICESCPNPCVTCIAVGTSVSCLSCTNGYLMTGGKCVFACPWGQYGDFVNSTSQCLSCSNGCSSCYISNSICSSCTTGYLLLQTICSNITNCPNGFYTDNTYNLCLDCHYPCKTCTNNATNCTSCQKGLLLNGICRDACPIFYYADYTNPQNPICSACMAPCIDCQGLSSCLSCSGHYYLHQGTCLLTCPSSFFPNSNNNTCTPCIPPCKTCSSASICLSCATGYLDGNGCTLQCNSSAYISSSFVCTLCVPPCLKCYSASLCLQCSLPAILFMQICITQTQCLNQTGYYPSLSNTSGQCSSCTFPCLGCINNSVTCTSCQPNYLFVSNTLKCVSACPPSYYHHSNNCSLCSSNCYLCNNSPDNCTLCSSGRYLDLITRTCQTTCPSNYYGDDQTQTCISCVLPCKTCYNAYLCTSCASGILYSKQCVSACPAGSVLNSSANICIECTNNCLTCTTTPSVCLSCSTGNYLSNYSCITSCPNGYYGNDYTNACDPCISPCNNCSSDSSCLSCLNNYYFFNNQCVSVCPVSYYSDNDTNQCLSCNLTICLTCTTNANNCLTCATGSFLHQLVCITTCPASTYPNAIAGTCDICPFPCQGCTNYTYCTSCSPSYYLFSNRCFSHCPISYYPDSNNICLPCMANCMYCSSLLTCIQCINNFSLLNTTCTTNCPSGYYLGAAPITNYRACLQCQTNCIECSSLDYCLTCISSLIQFNGMCLTNCPVFYFPINNTQCSQCSQYCSTCTNASVCISCIGTYLYQDICIISCPPQTYPYQGASCKNCTSPCFNCSGDYTCLTCITGYIYFHQYCVSACPSDVWYYPSNNSCNSDCPSPFNKLTSNMTCFTGNCGPTLVTLNGYCISTCGNGYYINPQQQCILCSNNPSLCNNLFTADLQILYIDVLTLHLYFNQKAQITNKSHINVQFVDINGNQVQQTLTEYHIDQYSIQLKYTYNSISLVNITVTIPYVASQDSQQCISINSYKQELPNYRDFSQYTPSNILSLIPLIFIIILAGLVVVNMCNQASRFVQLLDYIQLVAVTLYLNIQYPPILQSFLAGFKPSLFIFTKNMMPITPYLFSPPKFIYYNSDTFILRNQLLLLGIFLVTLIAFLVVIAINTYNKNNCKTLVKLIRYRLLNDLFSICLTPLFLFVCQIGNVHGTSLAITVFIILIGLCYVIWISYKIIQLKKMSQVEGLLGDFQRTESKVGLMYTPFGYVRRIVVTFGLGIAPYQPIATITLLLVLTFLTMICVYFYQPFDNQYTDYITIFMQTSLTLYVVCLIILGLNVLQPSNSHNMGMFVVSLVTATMAICIAWLIYLTINDIRTKGCFPKVKVEEESPDAKDDYSEKKYDQDEAQIRKMQGLSKLEKKDSPKKNQGSKITYQSHQNRQNQAEGVYNDSASGLLNRFRGESQDLISKKDNNDEFKHWNQQNSESNEGSGEGVRLPQLLIKIQRNEGSS